LPIIFFSVHLHTSLLNRVKNSAPLIVNIYNSFIFIQTLEEKIERWNLLKKRQEMADAPCEKVLWNMPAIGDCTQISKQAENQAQWPVPDMLYR
jgi:hypothetical protein